VGEIPHLTYIPRRQSSVRVNKFAHRKDESGTSQDSSHCFAMIQVQHKAVTQEKLYVFRRMPINFLTQISFTALIPVPIYKFMPDEHAW
jgi:hypothetical protein